MRPKPTIPTEAQEQICLAAWLDARDILWTATANGGKRAIKTAKALKASGVKPGVPDILIFTPPPTCDWMVARGAAIELKRSKGGTVSCAQHEWLAGLRHAGWCSFVARGADDAIKKLIELGY